MTDPIAPRRLAGLVGLAAALVLLLAAPALATYPGRNGRIAVITGPRFATYPHLATIAPRGGPVVDLSDNINGDVSWSPDGTRILGTEVTSVPVYVWVLSWPDGGLTNVDGPNVGWGSAPAWSNDGTQVAFGWNERRPVVRPYAVYVRRADGSTPPRALPSLPSGDAGSLPEWGRRDRRIALVGCAVGFPPSGCSVWTVRADGGGTARRVAPVDPPTSLPIGARSYDWSPATGLVAYTHDGGAWVTSAAGRPRVLLARDAAVVRWSPDGRRLLVRSGDGALATVGLHGRVHRVLGPDLSWASPVWSPNGRRIAFVAHGRGDVRDLFTIGVRGRGLRQLTDFAPGTEPTEVWGVGDWQALPVRRHHRRRHR